MPSAKSYQLLHQQVTSREGTHERLEALRVDTLAEIGLYELRQTLNRSQSDVAAVLGVSQSAISQLERSDDVLLSTLRNYVQGLGATLRISAVFTTDNEETTIPISIGQPTTT